MSDIEIIARGLGFPEGPVAMGNGSIIFTEINGGWVSRLSADGEVSRLGAAAGGPNGLAIAPDGALILCNNGGMEYLPGNFRGVGPAHDYEYGSIERIDPVTGARTLLYKEVNGRLLSAPNDIVFDRHGGFYFTDLGKRYHHHRGNGGLYYALPDGSSIREVVYPILSANGVGLSPDEKTVYVADTESARLIAFDIEAPGVVTKQPFPALYNGRLVGGIPGNARVDSLAVTADGNIAVATLITGQITVFAPDDRILYQVAVPDTHPTNLCFHGPDMRTATITLARSGELARMQFPEAGLKLNFQQ